MIRTRSLSIHLDEVVNVVCLLITCTYFVQYTRCETEQHCRVIVCIVRSDCRVQSITTVY